MPNVLFVCTANICRSPVAEVLFREWLRQHAVTDAWRVGSAGTWATAGGSASAYSQLMATQRGLNLALHAARRVDEPLLAAADVVLCLACSHREALHIEFPRHAARIFLWTALTGPGYDVDDPYGGPLAAYVKMAQELEGLTEKTAERIVALARERQTTAQ